MQLLRRLKTISLSNRSHLYLILVIITIFSLYFWILWIVVLLYVYKMRRFMNFFITFILIVASLSGYIFVNNRIDQINDQVMVTSKKSIDDYFVYTVSYQQKYYHMTSNQTFVLGSIITLKATVEYYESPSIPG